ncbi:hypothetical protein [Peribacillus muralis]|uniref:hypothetical protein n=1 Tax=Peribacillus muralis TaxID=264697 RepID=UPI0036729197
MKAKCLLWNETADVHSLHICEQTEFNSRLHAGWNGTEDATLLRELRVYLRPRRLKAEEAQGPPLDKGVPAVQ